MIHIGDCLEVMRCMAAGSVHTCVTSPPYFGLRDYGHDGQIGLEQKPEEYVSKLVEVFREVHRVLRDDGTLWLNLGDSYANDGKWGGSSGGKHASALHGATSIGRGKVSTGLKPKDLIGIPWRIAFALQEDGWFLRQDIIWSKPNPMPESVTDRCTKAHEYLFLLSKSQRYYFDAGAIREQAAHDPNAVRNRWDRLDYDVPGQTRQKRRSRAAVPPRHAACGSTQDGLDAAGRDGARNKRSVWTVATRPFRDAHFATFPEQLIEPCILAGAPAGGLVLDPFMGAGTTAVVAERLGRQWLGCELNPEYAEIAEARIRVAQPGFAFGETA
ncbi:TPA: site-specific DNA-methyltransferase [Stenotrophomonas maltophilia]|nr:site-specific DNA-methyltransferase [Stenotrophomonas maltophilia]HDX0816423.1 site-specific DNA-methyltransferase [Stenotrophomonas maltophilia]HDX0823764.1 site-specific DNA-methyltransferase [Stenotrophomonas maltophilia]